MKSCLKVIKYFVIYFAFVAVCFFLGIIVGGLMKGRTLPEIINGIDNARLLEGAGLIVLSIFYLFIAASLQIIVHEFGHFVLGWASGYKLFSFQVLGYAVVRENGKMKLKRFNIVGAAGQCLMVPPDKNAEDIPVIAYNAGGVLFNIILTSLSAVFLFLGDFPAWAFVFLLITGLVGLYIIIMNGFPMILSGGLPNDGYNIFKIRKNLKSKKAFIEVLRLNALIKQGMRPKDFPPSCFKDCEDVDFNEPLQVNLYSAYATYLLDNGERDKCESIYREIIEKEKKVMLLILDAKCELACLLFMKGCTDEAKSLLDDKDMKIVKAMSKTMSSGQRFLFFSAFYGDGDIATAQSIYQHVLDNKDNFVIKGETQMDLLLMKSALETAPQP